MATSRKEITRLGTVVTTDATPTDINFPDLTSVLSGQAIAGVSYVEVIAIKLNLSEYAMYARRCSWVKASSGNIQLAGTNTIGTDVETTGTMNISIKALPAAGITVTVTGIAATTLTWTVRVVMISGGGDT